VLNGDGSIAVGKYDPESLPATQPVIGWGPWSGGGTVSWIAAWAPTCCSRRPISARICEILDDTNISIVRWRERAAGRVRAAGGKGPLWWIPSQTVTLIDQGTRSMGTYQIDANGFIVPQNNGGENLTRPRWSRASHGP
jgi:hypothetical protein